MDITQPNTPPTVVHSPMYCTSLDSNTAIITTTALGIIQSVDRNCCAIFGYTIEELVGQSIGVLIPSPYREQHDQYMKNYLHTGVRRIIGKGRFVEGLHKNGDIFPISLMVTEMRINGELMFVGMIEKIEDSAAIVATSLEGIVVSCNKKFEEIFGYPTAKIIGQNISIILPPPHNVYHQQALKQMIEKKDPREYESCARTHQRNVAVRHRNASVFPMSLKIELIKVGQVQLFRSRFEEVFDRHGVLTLDNTGKIINTDHHFIEGLLGYTSDELIGQNIIKVVPNFFKEIHPHSKKRKLEGSEAGQKQSKLMQPELSQQLELTQQSSSASAPLQLPAPSPLPASPVSPATQIAALHLSSSNSPTTEMNEIFATITAEALHKDHTKFIVSLDVFRFFKSEASPFTSPTNTPPSSSNNLGTDMCYSVIVSRSSDGGSQADDTDVKKLLASATNVQQPQPTTHTTTVTSTTTAEETVMAHGTAPAAQQPVMPPPMSTTTTTTFTSATTQETTLPPLPQICQVDGKIVIAGYVLGRAVGKGSYGVVRFATHYYTGKPAAIKILNKELMEPSEYKRSTAEIQILKKLQSHPNIITLFDVVETDQHIFIITEYATGGDLHNMIEKAGGHLTEQQARVVFAQLTSALLHCHRQGIIHRDIKHKNILVQYTSPSTGVFNIDDVCIKLIDFGLSTMLDGDFTKNLTGGEWGHPTMKLCSTFCGTPAYAAPEMILSTKYTGPEVDVWSSGVILYSIVCGEMPFNKVSDIINGTYTPCPVNSSPEFRDLIKKMFVVNLKDRAKLMDVAYHPWFKLGTAANTTTLQYHNGDTPVANHDNSPVIKTTTLTKTTTVTHTAVVPNSAPHQQPAPNNHTTPCVTYLTTPQQYQQQLHHHDQHHHHQQPPITQPYVIPIQSPPHTPSPLQVTNGDGHAATAPKSVKEVPCAVITSKTLQ